MMRSRGRRAQRHVKSSDCERLSPHRPCLIKTCKVSFVFRIEKSSPFFHALGYCQVISSSLPMVQGGSNMTGTDLCVNKPHCAAAVRP